MCGCFFAVVYLVGVAVSDRAVPWYKASFFLFSGEKKSGSTSTGMVSGSLARKKARQHLVLPSRTLAQVGKGGGGGVGTSVSVVRGWNQNAEGGGGEVRSEVIDRVRRQYAVCGTG